MSGSLAESHYQVVKEQHTSNQLLLSDYSTDSSPTTIAVVTDAADSPISQYCDETMPALGLPEQHRKRYRQYRAGFVTNSAVDSPEHRAFTEANIEQQYREYLKTSDEAQSALCEVVRRLREGEDVTLVSFEKPSEPSHRAILKDVIESRLDSKFTFTIEEREAALSA